MSLTLTAIETLIGKQIVAITAAARETKKVVVIGSEQVHRRRRRAQDRQDRAQHSTGTRLLDKIHSLRAKLVISEDGRRNKQLDRDAEVQGQAAAALASLSADSEARAPYNSPTPPATELGVVVDRTPAFPPPTAPPVRRRAEIMENPPIRPECNGYVVVVPGQLQVPRAACCLLLAASPVHM